MSAMKHIGKYKCAVVVVLYTSTPSASELASFGQCVKVLGAHPIHILHPASLDLAIYLEKAKEYNKEVILSPFNDKHFKDVKAYNKLMLSAEFYGMFLKYQFILLYQLDAWVFNDELEHWCDAGYDYIGAPWFLGHDTATEDSPMLPHAGNGGFSLRRVEAIFRFLSARARYERELELEPGETTPRKEVVDSTISELFIDFGANEDILFAEHGPSINPNFKVASPTESIAFSFEVNARVLFKRNNNKLPFGCHAFEKYDWEFWKDKIILK